MLVGLGGVGARDFISKVDQLGIEVHIILSCLVVGIVILTPMSIIRHMSPGRTILGIAVIGGLSGTLLSWDWLRDGLAFIPFLVTQVSLILIFSVFFKYFTDLR